MEAIKKMNKVQSYWEKRYESLPNYIVVGRDMDGIIGWSVIHKKDEAEYRSSCYRSSITHGLSMRKSDMQELADKMNNSEK